MRTKKGAGQEVPGHGMGEGEGGRKDGTEGSSLLFYPHLELRRSRFGEQLSPQAGSGTLNRVTN